MLSWTHTLAAWTVWYSEFLMLVYSSLRGSLIVLVILYNRGEMTKGEMTWVENTRGGNDWGNVPWGDDWGGGGGGERGCPGMQPI